MDNSDRHDIDQWELDAQDAQRKFVETSLRESSLVFQVFSTPAGQELLGHWQNILMAPTAQAGQDLLSIGMNEGTKHMIRTVLNAVKQHEES